MAKGGVRPGAGRKSKAEELQLQTKLDPMEEDFLKSLHELIKGKNPLALKLYAEYRYGKPQDHVDVTSAGESIQIRFKDVE